MAFTVPSFPLKCNIYAGQGDQAARPSNPTQRQVSCQLRILKTAFCLGSQLGGTGPVSLLLLSSKADIRPVCNAWPHGDAVEVPGGSGRFYVVLAVDDVAKGFSNEYRVASIYPQYQRVGWWPIPTP